jgi:hypothetical protein
MFRFFTPKTRKMDFDKISQLAQKHPKPADYKYTYGTAGFRLM